MLRLIRVTPLLLAAAVLMAMGDRGHCQGARDCIVCFEVATLTDGDTSDVDIFAQRLTPRGEALWNGGDAPVPLGASTHMETDPVACEDGRGGAIVVFCFEYVEGEHTGDVDVVAQRVDATGKPLWNGGQGPQSVASSDAKELHPVVVADGEGGAIVVYEWVGPAGDSDILAQRIGGDGRLLWNDGERSTVVAASPRVERAPVVVPDGLGGVIVFLEWCGEGDDVDVMAQRVSARGEALWQEGERAIDVSDTDSIERHITAVSDGRGGAIAAFEFAFTAGEYAGDVDIMAQRISGDGEVLWNDGEEPAVVSSARGIERNPTAVPDGAGGVLVAFEYEPVEGEHAGDTDVLAQRLDGDGALMWNDGERSSTVSSSAGIERLPQAVPSRDGGAVIVCEHEFRAGENEGDIDVFAQRVSANGELMWNQGERSLMVCASRWLERSPVALADGRGGAVVVCTATGREGKYEGDMDVVAQRVDRDGTLMWNAGEMSVQVAASEALERRPCAVVIGGR